MYVEISMCEHKQDASSRLASLVMCICMCVYDFTECDTYGIQKIRVIGNKIFERWDLWDPFHAMNLVHCSTLEVYVTNDLKVT